ncbi:MAG: hypothetical protein FJ147_02880 [Deltaproteobacteria bacterium]|nr:hypothetical protein [Deltaproteobacteria bacterium]
MKKLLNDAMARAPEGLVVLHPLPTLTTAKLLPQLLCCLASFIGETTKFLNLGEVFRNGFLASRTQVLPKDFCTLPQLS